MRKRTAAPLLLMLAPLLLAPPRGVRAVELEGVVIRVEGEPDSTRIAARLLQRFKIQVDVVPKIETRTEPLAIRVELPHSRAHAWPFADVEVRDAQGKAMIVRRSGTEWFNLVIPVPGVTGSYVVQAVPLPKTLPQPTDRERVLLDDATRLRLGIARWHDGRAAALSIRFDDSHPTHLTKAVPILRTYGFRGTFMVNPGAPEPGSRRRSDFVTHQSEWEALARQGNDELANHSAHHRGALGDADMEAEVGDAARAIWKMTPGKSKLMALNLGGGTRWETTRTLRYYLEKYHQFDASENSTGMDDSYGNRVANFRRVLEQHIMRGLWCRIHYHSIGEGLSSSEANFRAALDVAREHAAQLWIAGMADIHKYQTERGGAKLTLVKSDPQHLVFRLSCQTDPELYDQPLTLEITPPELVASQPGRITVKDEQGQPVAIRTAQPSGQGPLRFDVSPRTAVYAVELTP